jgi:hypothetical protein
MGDGLLCAVADMFGPPYSTIKFMNQFWQNIVWATFWAYFFTNSSGHPPTCRSPVVGGSQKTQQTG